MRVDPLVLLTPSPDLYSIRYMSNYRTDIEVLAAQFKALGNSHRLAVFNLGFRTPYEVFFHTRTSLTVALPT